MLARRLAAELQDSPTAIYCSVIPRTIETADILAAALRVSDVVQDSGRSCASTTALTSPTQSVS